jgi:primase-polymerase (primpol)-like protein
MNRPVPLDVRPENIPEVLQAERRWVIWRYQWRTPKWTKKPYISTAPTIEAKSTDPATWSTFAAALAAYKNGDADGIGFVLGDGYVGFDQDGVLDLTFLQLLDSYTEASPSSAPGHAHAIARGLKPGDRCRVGSYELYSQGRYFTVTGHHIDGFPKTVEERPTEIRELYNRLFPTTATPPPPCQGEVESPQLSDEDVLVKAVDAANGEKFLQLWRGQWKGSYESHSEADFALCCLLAFWTGRRPQQMDRLFRQSGLMRTPKWDSRRGESTYGGKLVDRACSQTRTTYGTLQSASVAPQRVHGLRGLRGIC